MERRTGARALDDSSCDSRPLVLYADMREPCEPSTCGTSASLNDVAVAPMVELNSHATSLPPQSATLLPQKRGGGCRAGLRLCQQLAVLDLWAWWPTARKGAAGHPQPLSRDQPLTNSCVPL